MRSELEAVNKLRKPVACLSDLTCRLVFPFPKRAALAWLEELWEANGNRTS